MRSIPLVTILVLTSCGRPSSDTCGDGIWGPLEACEDLLPSHQGYCSSCRWVDELPGDGCGDGIPATYQACFDTRETVAVPADATGMSIADLEGDGDRDIFVVHPGGLTVLVNDGVGFPSESILSVSIADSTTVLAVPTPLEPATIYVGVGGTTPGVVRVANDMSSTEVVWDLPSAPEQLQADPWTGDLWARTATSLVVQSEDPPQVQWLDDVPVDLIVRELDARPGPELLFVSAPANQIWDVNWEETGQTAAVAPAVYPLDGTPIAVETIQIPQVFLTPVVLLDSGIFVTFLDITRDLLVNAEAPGATDFDVGVLDDANADVVLARGSTLEIVWQTPTSTTTWDEAHGVELAVESTVLAVEIDNLDVDNFGDIIALHADGAVTVLWNRP